VLTLARGSLDQLGAGCGAGFECVWAVPGASEAHAVRVGAEEVLCRRTLADAEGLADRPRGDAAGAERKRGDAAMSEAKIQKCTFRGCERTGLPNDGFDFYACEECLEELARLLGMEYEKGFARHRNN
jgi:hypothetical protein